MCKQPKTWFSRVAVGAMVSSLLFIKPTPTSGTTANPLLHAPIVTTSSEDLKLDHWLTNLAFAESGNRPGLKHLDSNHFYSYGCLQFQMGTWLSYGKVLGATPGNIYDCALQKRVARAMLVSRYENWKHWRNSALLKVGLPPHATPTPDPSPQGPLVLKIDTGGRVRA